MKRAELEKLIADLGIAPSKALGQNFLVDENFLDFIVREAAPKPGDRILEVGPGLGALTSRLLASGASVTAIEFDRKLAAWNRKTFVPRGLRLIEGDACRTDIAAVWGPGVPFRLISNLPYSAGTVIVANMLDLETPPSDMLLLLQKEVAFRFAADPGTEDYSALSVRIQNSYDVEILRKAIPGALFFPRPEVESALIRMTIRADIPSAPMRRKLTLLTRTAFAHRRKKMFKPLTAFAPPEKLREALEQAEIDPDTRAERVTPAQFRRLAELLFQA